MKKLLKKFVLVFISVLMIFGTTPISSFAMKSENNNSPLYIATFDCPQEYIDYAEENISKFIISTGDNIDYNNVSIGTPFAFADNGFDIFYFPVVINGNIKYLFRVYPDGNTYSAVITEFLAKELNEIAQLTSSENPLHLNMINNKITASIADEEYVLYEYPNINSNNEANTMSISNDNDLKTIDVKSSSNFELSFIQTRDPMRYISLKITETQGNNNWCAAYAATTILRTLGCSCTAKDAIKYFYPNYTNQTTITRSQVVQYAKKFGFKPKHIESKLSDYNLFKEIDAGRPVYLSMVRTVDNKNYSHAVVLRGYSVGNSTWTIWNPWFSYSESYSMNGSYVPTGYSSKTHSYKHKNTIYNWKK